MQRRLTTIKVIRAKLHGIKVTSADLDYHGSITLDPEHCELAGIYPLEFVEIWNKFSGARISTYVIFGTAGSRCCILRAAARTRQTEKEPLLRHQNTSTERRLHRPNGTDFPSRQQYTSNQYRVRTTAAAASVIDCAALIGSSHNGECASAARACEPVEQMINYQNMHPRLSRTYEIGSLTGPRQPEAAEAVERTALLVSPNLNQTEISNPVPAKIWTGLRFCEATRFQFLLTAHDPVRSCCNYARDRSHQEQSCRGQPEVASNTANGQ